jgi:hypothetical protein
VVLITAIVTLSKDLLEHGHQTRMRVAGADDEGRIVVG